jgi:hypothetical protein
VINRQAAGLAVKELRDPAVLDGTHRRMSRRHDVERFVRPRAARVGEVVAQIVLVHTGDRHLEIPLAQLRDRRCACRGA